jgi:hypothetical protein
MELLLLMDITMQLSEEMIMAAVLKYVVSLFIVLGQVCLQTGY